MNFLGIPREEGDFMSNDPVTMEALVGQFIDRYGLDQPGLRPEQALVEAWESIFGSFSAFSQRKVIGFISSLLHLFFLSRLYS